MDNASRHKWIARRFLVSILQQYGAGAPIVLRHWADDLETLQAEVLSDALEMELADDRPRRHHQES